MKTADSGYLTRRLVDVAQDVIIRSEDCNTSKGINMAAITEGEKVIVSLESRLLGRTCVNDVTATDGNVIVKANTFLSRDEVKKIIDAGVSEVQVRSPLTCECEYGICQKCYGWALTTNKPVDIGEAIGIIAAQSIGEPGTQLTMRTFHTGGVFRGSTNTQKIKTEVDGKVVSRVNTRELRTRHGDLVEVSVKDGQIDVQDNNGKVHSYNIPHGATVFYNIGASVKNGDIISEFEPGAVRGDASRLTEKATKDITSDLSGKVLFEGFNVDEKRDRQGNISRTANRSGKIWVLSGDVYNLPGGSKILVKDQQEVKKGNLLAETTTICEHGGEVRFGHDLEIQEIDLEGNKIKKIVNGKEITIVIASIFPDNAVLENTKKEQIWIVEDTGERYIVKSPVDTIVENGMIIAELLDEEYNVYSSGEIRYDGIEVDEHHIITKPGKIIFIPEEIHQVNKDSALKMVESGTFITAGTEIVKDIRAHIDGIVIFKEFNDLIHEVVIRPGELHKIDDASSLKVDDGDIVEAGVEIAPGLVSKEKCIVSLLSSAKFGLTEFEIEDIVDDFDEEIEPSMV